MKRRNMKQIKFYLEPELAEQFREILDESEDTAQKHLEAFVKRFVKKNKDKCYKEKKTT